MKYLIFVLLLVKCVIPQNLEEFRGVKITNVDSYVLYTDKNITSAMDYLSSIGINSILMTVWNKGYTLYPSKIMDSLFGKKIIPDFSGRDPLNRLLIEAHRNGMEVLPWFEYGFASHPSGGSAHILNKFPSWGLKDTSGKVFTKNEFFWMSAVNPEVQDFIIALTMETARNYDIDGVEYSDRIPALPVEGGYDSVTTGIYKLENNNQNPPRDYHNYNWMRWRANKMNTWYKRARDSVKNYDSNLFVDSSPSIYPWSYDEYLQDSKTWIDSGICDNIVPQLYRYSLSDYTYELDKAIGFVPINKRANIFSGMLIKVGSYVIDPAFFLNSMKANRDRKLKGEAFFFYEGLRANNSKLGDTLKATYYKDPALVPGRNQNNWRPKATIVDKTDISVVKTGQWNSLGLPGFKSNIIYASDTGYNSIEYSIDVPFSAWFGVYAYVVPNTINTSSAPYTIYSGNDSVIIKVDQKTPSNGGWQKLTDVFLTKGLQKVVKLDNKNIGSGKFVVSDAVMIMINRKLSPGVIVTGIDKNENEKQLNTPTDIQLFQNYPNPFNSSTRISYNIPKKESVSQFYKELVTLKVYDLLGNEMSTLVNDFQFPGMYSVEFSSKSLPTSIYFYDLRIGNSRIVKKMVLLK